MSRFSVTPEKEAELVARMAACRLREADIEEAFTCSGGPGGQKVNRTATCVQLRHGPTSLSVKMQKARTQALNRFYARRRLCEMIEAEQLGGQSREAQEQARVRKQKQRRGRRLRQTRREANPMEEP